MSKQNQLRQRFHHAQNLAKKETPESNHQAMMTLQGILARLPKGSSSPFARQVRELLMPLHKAKGNQLMVALNEEVTNYISCLQSKVHFELFFQKSKRKKLSPGAQKFFKVKTRRKMTAIKYDVGLLIEALQLLKDSPALGKLVKHLNFDKVGADKVTINGILREVFQGYQPEIEKVKIPVAIATPTSC